MKLTTLIFSKNRGCQLELLLRSLRFKVEQINLRVIYTYDPEYKAAYDKLIKLYPNIEFILEEDFQKQVISNITDEYLLFLTDDEVMINSFSEDCPEFKKFQANEDIVCLNLRMAPNYDYDFLKDKQVPIPKFDDGMWEWKNYRHDWGYPWSVGSHIFRKKDILPVLKTMELSGPHMLERNLRGRLEKPLMICFKKAKFVQIPVNRVAGDIQRSSKFIPASLLNDKFLYGYVIDLEPIIKQSKKTRSYFMPVDLKLIKKFSKNNPSKRLKKPIIYSAFGREINDDITIIFLTVNRVPENWAKYQRSVLEKAIGKAPVISISKKPLDFGINIIQTEPESSSNIYYQILKGCKRAKTPYIGIAEDDTLYEAEHYRFRPPLDSVAYNYSRLTLNLTQHPLYGWKNRVVNATMIGPRKLIIDSLEERYAKYPDGTPDRYTGEIGRAWVERSLGIIRRKSIRFYTKIPVIQFKHDYRRKELGSVRNMDPGAMRSFDICHWGKASDLVKKFR